MQTITQTKDEEVVLSKAEFLQLKQQAEAYQELAAKFFDRSLDTSVESVVKDFRQTNLYSEEFLNDLADGLGKSSYGK